VRGECDCYGNGFQAVPRKGGHNRALGFHPHVTGSSCCRAYRCAEERGQRCPCGENRVQLLVIRDVGGHHERVFHPGGHPRFRISAQLILQAIESLGVDAFIADVRATYGADLPFVVTRLSDGQTYLNSGYLATIRAAQVTVADADPLTVWTDTDGFGLAGDHLHFDVTGQQQLGNATGGALLSFLPVTTNPTLDYDGDGNLVIVLEHAFPGYSYVLQSNPGLDSKYWTDVESVTATGPLVFFTYPSSGVGSKRFFRLSSVPDN
jgi:hypothetical protein